MRYINLATEDELSESVGKKLVANFLDGYEIRNMLRKNGNGYLRSKLKAICELARINPVLLITDLDNNSCAYSLKSSWLGDVDPPEGLIFRIAVREIEAWIMADYTTIRTIVGSQAAQLPMSADSIIDPKEFLLRLVSNGGPRDIKRDLLPANGAVASQGLAYNQRLSHHVLTVWNPEKAAERSDSLARLLRRLRELNKRVTVP